MRIVFVFIILTLISSFCIAQETITTNDGQIIEDVYQEVDIMCEFPGGVDKLFEYLGKSIVYPEEALERGTQGVVYANFIVLTTGEILNIRILRGIGDGCDEEVVRILEAMPQGWSSSYKNGEKVNTSFTLPIRFTRKMNSSVTE